MTDNPYQSPQYQDDPEARGRFSGRRQDLYSLALCQKIIQPCVSGLFLTIVGIIFTANRYPSSLAMLVLVGMYTALALTAAVSVFVASAIMDGVALGIMLGCLALIPCMGLIVLLIINQRAASVLQLNGIRVGLIGAKMEDFAPK